MLRPASLTDFALLVLLAAIYGSAFSAIGHAVPVIGPVGLVLCRVAIAFAILLPFCVWKGWVWPSTKQAWAQVGFLCLFNLLIPFFLVSWAQLTIPASLMALIMGAGPIFGLLIAHWATHDDRLTLPKGIGVCLGFAGIVLVLGRDAMSEADGAVGPVLLAEGAALLASFCYAASGLLVRRTQGLPPTQLAALVLGMGTFILLITLPVSMPDIHITFGQLQTSHWMAITYLGVVTTGLAYILRYRLIRTVGMGYFGISIYLVPVFGIAIAAVLLDEPITPTLMLGLLLVVGGLVVARLPWSGKKPASSA